MKQIASLLTVILTVTFVVSPALTDPFTGFRVDQLPNPQINPPIQPAGYAFAIWGLIYGWLLVSAVFGVVKRRDDADWHSARKPLILSLATGTTWLAVANASAVWATILIFLMAVTAIAALVRAPQRDGWLFRAPVAIYAGWLTAASFVSLGSTAAGYGIVTGAMGWAYLGIVGALAVAILVLRATSAAAYGFTVVWALVGIMAANGSAVIGVTALAGAGCLIVLALMAANHLNGRSALS